MGFSLLNLSVSTTSCGDKGLGLVLLAMLHNPFSLSNIDSLWLHKLKASPPKRAAADLYEWDILPTIDAHSSKKKR